MCPSVVVYAVDHIVAPSPSNNTRTICILICAWNNYVSYTLVYVHFIVCSMYVSSCSTPSFSSPSFSSPANSAIPFLHSCQPKAVHYYCGVYCVEGGVRRARLAYAGTSSVRLRQILGGRDDWSRDLSTVTEWRHTCTERVERSTDVQ